MSAAVSAVLGPRALPARALRADGRVGVKICGIRDVAGLAAAADAGADWIGLVFFAASPRAITPEAAARLVATVPGGPGRVGLFVDPTDAEIAAACALVRLDALQVYAGPERTRAIAARFDVPVWRAVGVGARADLPQAGDGAARWLIESRPPPGASRPGGNAHAFDWALTAGWLAGSPWLLAGGLTADTVAAAIRTSGAQAVDVSSGVEATRGVKSPALIRAFVSAARASPTVTRADPDDAAEIAEAHVAAWRETYPDMLPSDVYSAKTVEAMTPIWARTLDAGEPVFVARARGAIVGLGAAGAMPNMDVVPEGELRALYILRRAQRCGLGRAILGAVAGDMLARGLRRCRLWVLDANSPAIAFYESFGGQVVGHEVKDGVAHTAYGWDDVSAWLAPRVAAESAG